MINTSKLSVEPDQAQGFPIHPKVGGTDPQSNYDGGLGR